MQLVDLVAELLAPHYQSQPQLIEAKAYAPSNIALSKYWGKRDTKLNLPMTGSLSISLAHQGTWTRLQPIDAVHHCIHLNDKFVEPTTSFARRLSAWLELVLPPGLTLAVQTQNTIPTAAGLASSASGFAALVRATDRLMGWQLTDDKLSVLARLGSGSACRSLWHGFVEWRVGQCCDGRDSFAELLPETWPQLRLGLLKVSTQAKLVSSRQGMLRTIQTSALYEKWPVQAESDLRRIRSAIAEQDFHTLGMTAEHNAMTMHATMAAAWPPLVYWQPESLVNMHQVWKLRQLGVPVYLTMDAGPNLKLLFLEQNQPTLQEVFSQLQVVAPFQYQQSPN